MKITNLLKNCDSILYFLFMPKISKYVAKKIGSIFLKKKKSVWCGGGGGWS